MPSDLRLFRRLTLGKPVIMGRKTFLSIGRPLDGRDNIVLTRDPSFAAQGATVFSDVQQALRHAETLARRRGAEEVAVIGGEEVYQVVLPLADRIYLTRVHASPDGDAFFRVPELDQWRETSRQPVERTAKDEHGATLIVLDRSHPP